LGRLFLLLSVSRQILIALHFLISDRFGGEIRWEEAAAIGASPKATAWLA